MRHAAFDPFRQHLERLSGYVLEEIRRTLLNPEGALQLRASGLGGEQLRPLPVAYRSSRPSWFRVAEQREGEFSSFPEAFERNRRRVVLLGEPGGGKTTTLLAFAREAVSRRLADPHAQPSRRLGSKPMHGGHMQSAAGRPGLPPQPNQPVRRRRVAERRPQPMLLASGTSPPGRRQRPETPQRYR